MELQPRFATRDPKPVSCFRRFPDGAGVSRFAGLAAAHAGHEPALLPHKLNRVPAAHAVRTLVSGVKGIGHTSDVLRV